MSSLDSSFKTSDKSARAERLKRIRLMAGLSRREICEGDEGLHADTYKGWETARFGGLTERGAQKVIQKVAKHGVVCTVNWLLFGIGPAPYEDRSSLIPVVSSVTEDERQMAKELAVFREIPNSVDIVLSGDEMRPHFRAGDIVGGVKLSNFSEAIGEICIVQSTEGEILLRLLQVGNSPNNFTLLTLQPLAGGASPLVTPGVELSMVARVVWHRRPL